MRFLLLLIFTTALAAASSNVRFAHLSSNTTTLDVLLDGTVVTTIDYNTISQYYSTNATHVVLQYNAAPHTVVYNETLAFADLSYYTLFVTGANDVVSPILVLDNNVAPANQFGGRLRLFQGVSDVANAEFLIDGAVAATLAYKAFAYVDLTAGPHTVAFRPSTAATPTNSTQITVAGGQVYTLAFGGLNTDLVWTESTDAAYTYFSYRVAHLSPDAPAVDLYLNSDSSSTKVASNVAFKTVSDYAQFAALNGVAYKTVVTAVNNASDILSSSPIQVTAGAVWTIALSGLISPPASFQISYWTDNNAAPTSSWTNNVRFFVGFPGLTTEKFSLLVNGQPVFTDILSGQVTGYQPVQTGTYTVSVSDGSATVASANFEFIGGGVFTVIAEGIYGSNSTKPGLIIKQDAAYTYFTVRATNAAPDVNQATFVLRDANNQDVFNFGAVAYGAFSTYQLLPLQPSFIINVQSGGNTIYNHAITFKTGDVATLSLFGAAATPNVVALADTNTAPSASTKSRVRFVNGLLVAPNIDVKFNGANQFTAVAFQTASPYSEIPAGTYTVDIFVGAEHVFSANQTVTGGAVYTIIAEGIALANSTIPVSLAVSQDQTYQYFQLRVNHASSNLGAIDVLLDDGQTSTTVFSNLQYQQSTVATEYTELVLYNVSFKVTPHGVPTNVVYSVYPNFAAGASYTVTLYGLAGANVSTPLTTAITKDVNGAPVNSTIGRIRFLHAVAGGSLNLDVLFNDKRIFSNVAYGDLIDYTDLAASSNYRIDLYVANTNNHTYALNSYVLAGGQDTLLVAMGTPTATVIVPYVYVQYTYFQLRFIHTSPDAGTVSVVLEGQTIFSDVSFGNITQWAEFTSDKQNLAVVSDGVTLISRNQPFIENAGNTLLFVGLKVSENNSVPLQLVVNVLNPTKPTSNTVSSIRVIHVAPNTPALQLKFNDTAQFTGVQYLQVSDYKEIPAGTYTVSVWSDALNHSLAVLPMTFTGGNAFTVLIEGTGNLTLDTSVDYVPPTTGSIRFLHASPNTAAVDLLVDGSADFRNVAFETANGYVDNYPEGTRALRVVPTDQTVPTLVEGQVNVVQNSHTSVFLIGLQKTNENDTSTLETWTLLDEHVLPAAGDVLVRFVHASPNAPSLDLRLNGATTFPGVNYKNYTAYRLIEASLITVEAVETGKTDALFTSKFDLSVPEGESAIYTLVAEGTYGKDLKVISFLDNGPLPPQEPSPSGSKPNGLSPAAIGGIVAGVVVAVIAAVAVGYIVYRRRKRAGYSEIATTEPHKE